MNYQTAQIKKEQKVEVIDHVIKHMKFVGLKYTTTNVCECVKNSILWNGFIKDRLIENQNIRYILNYFPEYRTKKLRN